jgi:type IV pilus assembly protein PilB
MTSTAPPADRIGDLLVRDGLVTREQLDRALADADQSRTRVGVSLVKLGMLGEQELVRALSRQQGVSAADLSRIVPDPKLVRLLSPELALKHLALPLRRVGRSLTVAMADPTDRDAIEVIEFATGFDVEPVIAAEYALRRAIEREYGFADDRIGDLVRQFQQSGDVEPVEDEEDEPTLSALQAQVEDAPVVRLINGIMTDAVARGASDIHFECYEREIRVRYRIDGVLHEIMKPPLKMRAALISRFKILSDLNIAERRLPQDGRIKLRIGRRVIDFRVSTLPTLFGEKIVLRILDRQALTLDLERFGMEPQAEDHFRRAINHPYGMVLVTGPTGSGKTTTLYSALARINSHAVNIMTAEDPVEYSLHGINQLQVRPEIGLDFAVVLKALLRQDPNVILVGEIRDSETAGIAIKAALTGHLVLSTLHTNDAPSTITRLVDMGVEPFNVASALTLITAQRLVRRICTECREPAEYSDEWLRGAGIGAEQAATTPFFRGRGCEHCGGTGYRGRQGLYEVMAMSAALRRLILRRAPTTDLREQAVSDGMLTLRSDGMLKVARGITTLEEVIKETAAEES